MTPQGPLAGTFVLDLSRVLAGPWATQLLADLGAEVIKVERPGAGDDTRAWGPPFTTTPEGERSDAAYYFAANRNKRSVTVDMARPEGADLLRRLAAKADVVVENFKTGGLKKYGLDKPAMVITIGAGSARTVLEVGKTDGDQTFARDASRAMVFTLDSTLKDDLTKSVDAYRKKELFDMRPFYVPRFRVVREAAGASVAYDFEKVPPAKPTEQDTWKVTRNGAPPVTVESNGVDDLLGKLAGIKAD